LRSFLVLFVAVMFSLGCMGAVNSLTGLDLQIEVGEDAVHPADFPASEPAVGEKLMSMGMTADADSLNLPDGVQVDLAGDQQYRLEIVAYAMNGASASDALAAARSEVEAAGFVLISEAADVFTYEKGGVLFVLVDPAASDDDSLSMMRLEPVPAVE